MVTSLPGTPGGARHSDDTDAYHLFLKDRHFRYTKFDLKNALHCFEQAVERDHSCALARIAVAETLTVLVIYRVIPPPSGQARAREQLRTARELGGETAQGLGVEAFLAYVYDWDPRAALAAYERSLELDPTSSSTRAWYTWALLATGRVAEALE